MNDIVTIGIALGAGIAVGGYFTYKFKTIKLEKVNKGELEEVKELLTAANYDLKSKKEILENLDIEISTRRGQLNETIIQETSIVQSIIEQEKQRAREAFIAYIDTLDNSYIENEALFDEKKDEILSEINKLKDIRDATIAAHLREKEIKEQTAFYSINLLDEDIADITILEGIKPQLRHPEVLSKLIWTTYYQKQLNTLCANIIGEKKVSGIYKITDTVNDLAYIGQSVDIAQRWKDHVKAALGASGTASNNKLYAAMRQDGVYNFTFEVLELCPPEQLNMKERSFIEIYKTDIYGLNGQKGNN